MYFHVQIPLQPHWFNQNVYRGCNVVGRLGDGLQINVTGGMFVSLHEACVNNFPLLLQNHGLITYLPLRLQ